MPTRSASATRTRAAPRRLTPVAAGVAGGAAGERERSAPRAAVLQSPATLLLIAALLASAAVLLYETRNITFLLDDWDFLLGRPGFTADSLLTPHNEHLHLIPILVYKALLEVFGMDSARPFQVAAIATFLTSTALLYAWLRERIGEVLALGGVALVLFLGAAWEDLLWAFQIGYFGSMAAGIGMLLSLRQESPRGDVVACVLIVTALAFSSLGIPFAIGAAVAIATGPDWRRRAFIVVIPAVLYGLWYLGWGHEATNHISLRNVANSPLYVFNGIAAAISSLFGMATPRDESGVGAYDWGRTLAVFALGVAAWRIHRLGSIPRWLWVLMAIALSFWLLSAFNQIPGRDPSSSRYQYIGGILVLMIAAELLRGVRVGPAAFGIGGAVIALAVLSNLSFLDQAAKSYEATSDLIGANLGAIEIARDTVDPGFVLTDELAGTAYVHVPAGSFFAAADQFGSPADTPAEIATAPEPAREAADRVLAGALGVAVVPAEKQAGAGCPTIKARPDKPAVVNLPPGGAVISGDGAATNVDLRMRRFAATFPIGAGSLVGEQAVSIPIMPDRSDRAWQLQASGRGEVGVCPQPAA